MIITAGQIIWTAECEKALADPDEARAELKALKRKWVAGAAVELACTICVLAGVRCCQLSASCPLPHPATPAHPRTRWVSYLNKLTAITRSRLNKIERNKAGSCPAHACL